jgi:hypothetical protein
MDTFLDLFGLCFQGDREFSSSFALDKNWGSLCAIGDACQTRVFCVANCATSRAARSGPSLRNIGLLGMTT